MIGKPEHYGDGSLQRLNSKKADYEQYLYNTAYAAAKARNDAEHGNGVKITISEIERASADFLGHRYPSKIRKILTVCDAVLGIASGFFLDKGFDAQTETLHGILLAIGIICFAATVGVTVKLLHSD